MLSAFQLENNRLTRLEADEIKHLASSVWVDLVEPDDDERSRVQTELGQNLATRPELEDIEASARFFEDEDGLHIHSFFFLKMPKITLKQLYRGVYHPRRSPVHAARARTARFPLVPYARAQPDAGRR